MTLSLQLLRPEGDADKTLVSVQFWHCWLLASAHMSMLASHSAKLSARKL